MTNETTTTDRLPELIQRALDVRHRAYAPYSHYQVGAALLSNTGLIFEGVNVENAAFPSGTCAERTAVFSAVTQGQQQFETIVIASENGGAPCGACRQVLREFAPDLRIVTVNQDGSITLDTNLQNLLPHSFGPENLPPA
ncbi:MAG: cytidine deaminase [Anaerolineales bacterium]|jgi:cytidine deaminase